MIHVCTQKVLHVRGGAMWISKQWPIGCRLAVAFLDGDQAQHDRVVPYFHAWEKFANITFVFVTNLDNAQARVTFKPGESWSYVGNEAQTIASPEPTMGLGWINPDTSEDEVRRVVLHE